MDRFAFLACQPYLLPASHRRRRRARYPRASLRARPRPRHSWRTHRQIARRPVRGASFGCVVVRVLRQLPLQPGRAVRAVGVPGRERVPDGRLGTTGHRRRRDGRRPAPGVRAHGSQPRPGAADVRADGARTSLVVVVVVAPPPGGCVDVILDGARFELDMRQCRAVVEGRSRPATRATRAGECGSMNTTTTTPRGRRRTSAACSPTSRSTCTGRAERRVGRRRGTPCARCAARWSARQGRRVVRSAIGRFSGDG